MKKSFAMAVAAANAVKLNKCACTDQLGNYYLEDADLFAPKATIVQDQTYVDGLGNTVNVRTVSPGRKLASGNVHLDRLGSDLRVRSVSPFTQTVVQDQTYVDGLGRSVTVRSISPATRAIVQDQTYIDGLGRAVTVRSISPATRAILQDQTYIDGLGRRVTVRSVSPAQGSTVITTQPQLLGTQPVTIIRPNKSNLGLDNALDAPGTKIIGVGCLEDVQVAPGTQQVIKRTVTKQIIQPEIQLGSSTRDACLDAPAATTIYETVPATTQKIYVVRHQQTTDETAPPQSVTDPTDCQN